MGSVKVRRREQIVYYTQTLPIKTLKEVSDLFYPIIKERVKDRRKKKDWLDAIMTYYDSCAVENQRKLWSELQDFLWGEF